MGTTIRSTISKNNKYWVDKHRYYELKHFCLQYKEWKRLYSSLDSFAKTHSDLAGYIKLSTLTDKTTTCAIARLNYKEKIDMVEKAAKEADLELSNYILLAVTENLSYAYLQSKLEIPCGRDMYYDRYRKFFWLLDKSRN